MPYQKGVSGNPNGRPPKDKTVSELQNRIGYGLILKNEPNIEMAVEKLFEHVMKGSPWAIKAALEYFMGKPRPYNTPETSEYTEASYFVKSMPPEIRQEYYEKVQELMHWVNSRAKEDMH